MQTIPVVVLLTLVVSVTAADRPTGQGTPEGVACDAVQAYVESDSEAWLATLVRPIYGMDGDVTYADFKQQMTAQMDANAQAADFPEMRIVRVYRSRELSMKGPASMAFALFEFTGNRFVDIELDVGGGRIQSVRYHVLGDADGRWSYEPRPDLASVMAMGMNQESASVEVLWEAAEAEPPAVDDVP